MNLYAESSAVLAWLLAEPAAPEMRRRLEEAEHIIASNLTVIECERVLLRAEALGELDAAQAADCRSRLRAAAAHWHRLHIAGEVVERACQPFPGHPVRTLDAIHLASFQLAAMAVTGLRLLSLDLRVRAAATALGLSVEPQAWPPA